MVLFNNVTLGSLVIPPQKRLSEVCRDILGRNNRQWWTIEYHHDVLRRAALPYKDKTEAAYKKALADKKKREKEETLKLRIKMQHQARAAEAKRDRDTCVSMETKKCVYAEMELRKAANERDRVRYNRWVQPGNSGQNITKTERVEDTMVMERVLVWGSK